MILVTGGAGYIGSHVCLELLNAGNEVVVLDNFCTSSKLSILRVQEISGKPVLVEEGDIRDRAMLERLFQLHNVTAVIHLAGLKSIKESHANPLSYYDCNVNGTMQLLIAMGNAGVKKIVFSSSATVYGSPRSLPLSETHALAPINPYGRTKLFVEQILADLSLANPDWRVGILRYFNPVGAHESGLIGEDPIGSPNNLMPYVAQVAVGRRDHLNIWGNNHPTSDGTGVRDYVHVVDIAAGHVSAINYLDHGQSFEVNLGTGNGFSVLDVVRAFESASGKKIPYIFGPRREGDVSSCYADASAAKKLLGWKAHRDLSAMCLDHWRWQKANPDGYSGRAISE